MCIGRHKLSVTSPLHVSLLQKPEHLVTDRELAYLGTHLGYHTRHLSTENDREIAVDKTRQSTTTNAPVNRVNRCRFYRNQQLIGIDGWFGLIRQL